MDHIQFRDIVDSAMEYSQLKSLTDDLIYSEPVNWAPALAPFSSSQHNSWWSEWKLHLRNRPVALYCTKINPEYHPTINEVLLTLLESLFLIIHLFLLLINDVTALLTVDRIIAVANKGQWQADQILPCDRKSTDRP
jgi:hypothetical protein